MKQRQLTVASRSAAQPQQEHTPQHSAERILLDHPRGPDWVHPAIFVRDTGSIGLGLFAADLISAGSTVILFGGNLMSWREVCELPEDMQDIPYQVDDNVFFGIARPEDIGVGERINHSCNPNTGFVSEMKLVALRDILPGEDVTMDYGTCSSLESYQLICRCGQSQCRGVISGNDWKLPDLQHRLRGYFQPYLQEKIRRLNKRGIRCMLSNVLRTTAGIISPED